MTQNGKKQSLILLAVAAVAAAGGYYGDRLVRPAPTTGPAAAEEETPAVPVKTAVAHAGELAEVAKVYGVAQTRPTDATALSVQFDAVPTAVHVTAGDVVPAGGVLVELRPSSDARLQLVQAEQALAAATRSVEQTVRRRDEQLATNADVTTAELARQTAQTQLDALKARGVGEAQTLRADKPVLVLSVAAQPGQATAAGTPLIVVSPVDSIEVRIGVDPADAAALAPGMAVTVALPGTTNTLAGTLRRQSYTVNPQTRLCDVFVDPNAAGGIRPGTFVEVAFPTHVAKGLVVPRTATQMEDGDWCVYTVKDDKAVRCVVALGPSDGQDIVVTGDKLADGDSVVVERNGELQDGAAVHAEPAEEDDK